MQPQLLTLQVDSESRFCAAPLENSDANMDKMEARSALRAQLLEMLIQQGNIFTNWIKFSITVQGGLAAGLGFAWSDLPKYGVLGFMIAVFGFLTSVLFAGILYRHAQWAAWYVKRCNNLAAIPKIVPGEKGEIGEQDPGRIGWAVVAFFSFVAITWIVLANRISQLVDVMSFF
jgi:hypothetical protein